MKSAVPRGQAPPPQRGPPQLTGIWMMDSQGRPWAEALVQDMVTVEAMPTRKPTLATTTLGNESGFGDPNSLSSGQSSHSAPQKAAFAYSKDSSPTQREDQGVQRRSCSCSWLDRAHCARRLRVLLQQQVGSEPVGTPMELDYPL